jgi:hypothetical protein
MIRILLTALLTLLLPASYSQYLPLFEDLAEEFTENDDETGQELVHEMLSDLLRQPLNLNACSESDLNASGLFSPFQVYGILKYRERYGPFFSIYELAAIPGFTQELLRNVAPLIALSDLQANTSRPAPRGMLLSNIAIRLPASMAYKPDSTGIPVYPGSPLKFTSRLRVDAGDRWSAAAAFEKDPGEFWMNKGRPEHFTGYLEYSGNKCLRKVTLGNFRIHRGMGLVHGLGFRTAGSGVVTGGYRRSYSKAFASTMEYDYYRGMYADLATGKWSADLFCSVKPEDISLFRLTAPVDLFEQVRKTGLHRTESERNGTDLARQQTAGFSVNRSSERWYLGMALAGTRMELTQLGRDSADRFAPGLFQTSPRGAVSIYGVAFGNRYELFGEAAINQHTATAVIAGGTLEVNPALQTHFSFRRFEQGYTGLTPKAFSAGTRPENETGINWGFSLAPFNHARLLLNTDISHKNILPGEPAVPGFYLRNHLVFSYVPKAGPELELKITGRSKQKNSGSDGPGNGEYLHELQYRFRLNGRYTLSDRIILSARLEQARLKTGGRSYSGKILYSQITVIPAEKVRITYRYLAFDSEHWDNRIYTYEPGVRYSFLFPAWYGTGTRNLLVLSAKLGRRFTLRSKMGLTAYAHRRETGSAYDIRPGNRAWDGELQIQLDL